MSFSGLFLRYPSDADKHLLARQTGLSRNQVPFLLSLSSILMQHDSKYSKKALSVFIFFGYSLLLLSFIKAVTEMIRKPKKAKKPITQMTISMLS